MKLVVDCRWVTGNPNDPLSRMTRGIVHAMAERRRFVMIVGPSTPIALLPALPWELLPTPYSPADLLTGRRLNSIGTEILFTPAPSLAGIGRRFGLIAAGGTPHADQDAAWPERLRTVPGRIRLSRALILRSADVVIGVSRAQQRNLLGDSAADQPVVVLHAEDTASVSPADWRESAKRLDSVIDELHRSRRTRGHSAD